MGIPFKTSKPFTLGAELELQLLNPSRLRLTSSSVQILENLGFPKNTKAEMYQCMLEMTSGICAHATEVGQQLAVEVNRTLIAARELDVVLAAAGLHPTDTHQNAKLFPEARYARLVAQQRWVANRLLIFGFHIHIGMRDAEHAVRMINGISWYLPLLLALSSSSPFFRGEDTKLASCRTTFFEAIPTGGHGCQFTSWPQFEQLFAALKKAGTVFSPRDIWWDVRPSPELGTIEVRICDAPSTLSEAVALIALCHLICERIDRMMQNRAPAPAPFWLLRENKWRAARDGVAAEFISDESGSVVTAKDWLWQLIDEMADRVRAHGYTAHMNLLKTIVVLGSSSDRQRQAFIASGGDFRAVGRHLVEEFVSDRPNWARADHGGKSA